MKTSSTASTGCRWDCGQRTDRLTELSEVQSEDGRRVTRVRQTKDEDGQVVCTSTEDFARQTLPGASRGESALVLIKRKVEHGLYPQSVTIESFDEAGELVTFETSRHEHDGSTTHIVIHGHGKSATTRIQSGDLELRASERIVMIETPTANYRFMPFEGSWTTYYKESRMSFRIEASFLKQPEGEITGPDGFKLVFANSRLIDFSPGG